MYAAHLLDRHLVVPETNGLEPIAQHSHQQLLVEALRIREARSIDGPRTLQQACGLRAYHLNVRQRIVGQPGVVLVLAERGRGLGILAQVELPVIVGERPQALLPRLIVGRGRGRWRRAGRTREQHERSTQYGSNAFAHEILRVQTLTVTRRNVAGIEVFSFPTCPSWGHLRRACHLAGQFYALTHCLRKSPRTSRIWPFRRCAAPAQLSGNSSIQSLHGVP